MEEKGGSGSGSGIGDVGTSGDGGDGGEQLLTVKHELRTGERPRPLPAEPGRGGAPCGHQGLRELGVRGGPGAGPRGRAGRGPGVPEAPVTRAKRSKVFLSPGNRGGHGDAFAPPFPAQVTHLSLHLTRAKGAPSSV